MEPEVIGYAYPYLYKITSFVFQGAASVITLCSCVWMFPLLHFLATFDFNRFLNICLSRGCERVVSIFTSSICLDQRLQTSCAWLDEACSLAAIHRYVWFDWRVFFELKNRISCQHLRIERFHRGIWITVYFIFFPWGEKKNRNTSLHRVHLRPRQHLAVVERQPPLVAGRWNVLCHWPQSCSLPVTFGCLGFLPAVGI